jgi:hypothetical protein
MSSSTTPNILTLAIRRGRRFVAVHVHSAASRCYANTHARERARSGRLQTFSEGVGEATIRSLVTDETVHTYESLEALREDIFADVERAPHLDVPA